MEELKEKVDDDYIKNSLLEFIQKYNFPERDSYWLEKSKDFYNFWNTKIRDKGHDLKDDEIDYLIRIIDDKASGHNANNEAIALIGIRQSRWRKAIRNLKDKIDLQNIFDHIINTSRIDELPELINKFLVANEKNKNGFNGEFANMINAFLFLKDPNKFLSVVSLKHRKWIIEELNLGYFGRGRTKGEQIINSNFDILENFKTKYGVHFSPRSLSEFFYTPFGNCEDINIKQLWYKKTSFAKNAYEKNSITISGLEIEEFSEVGKNKKNEKIINGKCEYSPGQQIENNRIGKLGEDIVFRSEIDRLKKEGHAELIEKIKIVSDNIKLGYDVLSCNKDGSKRYIEVKSTKKGLNHCSFFISDNELNKSKELSNYYLYIVYNVDKKPKIKYLESPDINNEKLFKLLPKEYLVIYSHKAK